MSSKRTSEEAALVSPAEKAEKRSRSMSTEKNEEEISMWLPPPSVLPKSNSSTPNAEILVSESLSSISPESDGIIKPHGNDVVCRRGGRVVKNPGNALYRKLIDSKKKLYKSCNQEYKAVVAISIVDSIHDQKPPGRFLHLDSKTGLWFEIGKMKAIQKTSMALAQTKREPRKKTCKLQVTDLESNGSDSDGRDVPTLEEVSELTHGDNLVPLPYFNMNVKKAATNIPAYDNEFVSFMTTQPVLHALFDDGNNFGM